MDVDSIRNEIPVTRSVVYMNTGWSGPSPQSVVRATTEFLEAEAADGPTTVTAMERRADVERTVRRRIATLLNGDGAEVALTDNTTEGINIVVNGLPWKDGDRLVTTDVEHPGIMIPALFAARRHRLDLVTVACDADASPQALVDAFDRAIRPGTRLVAVSHVSYANGLRLPLGEIVAIAHRRGALVLADGAQTAGQLKLDMRALGIDFYSIAGHKWLCGPDGTGALFVRRDRLPELAPTKVGYWAVISYDAKGHLEENLADARRYQVSTTNGGLWAGLSRAIEIACEAGLEAIEERSTALASYAVSRLLKVPRVRVISPREGPGMTGLVCFQVEGVEADGVTGTLWERGSVVARSVAGTACTRLSLAYFNTEAEIDRAVDTVEALVSRGPVDVEKTEWYRVMHGPAEEV